MPIHFSHKTFKTLIMPVSLRNWSQTVQKHPVAVSFHKSLCIPLIPLIDDNVIPFWFSEAVVSSNSNKFLKFHKKYLCLSLFVAEHQPATLLEKTPALMFSREIYKIFKNTFPNIFGRLLLRLAYFSAIFI